MVNNDCCFSAHIPLFNLNCDPLTTYLKECGDHGNKGENEGYDYTANNVFVSITFWNTIELGTKILCAENKLSFY